MSLKLGFLLSHIGESELGRLFIKNANDFLESDTSGRVDIIAFVSNQSWATTRPSFASMNINEAFDFNGCVVATDIYTAEKIVTFPGPTKLYYYLWELAWTKDSHRTFEENLALYNNPRLSFISRTEDDSRMFEKCWNRPVKAVIADCDVRAFVEMVRKDDKK